MSEEIEQAREGTFDFVDFFAGWFASAAGSVAGQPFDTIKVRMAAFSKQTNMFRTGMEIIKREGVYGLYKGSLSPICGIGVVDAILFGVYSNSSRWFARRLKVENTKLPIRYHFLCGMFAGAVANAVNVPFELIKVQLQVQEHRKLGNIQCVKNLIKSRGLLGIYQGWWATLLRDCPAFGVFFGSYQLFKNLCGASNLGIFVAGGLAGCTCWISIYPFDVIKSKIQSLPPRPEPGWNKYTGIWDCARKTYRSHGVRGFTRGLGPCLVRAAPANCVTFLVFETLLKFYAFIMKKK